MSIISDIFRPLLRISFRFKWTGYSVKEDNMGLLDKIKTIVVRKYLLGYLVDAYKAIDGNKTQIIMVLAACVWGTARLHYITPEQEKNLYEMFGGAGSITFLAKLNKWKDEAEKLGTEIKSEKEIK